MKYDGEGAESSAADYLQTQVCSFSAGLFLRPQNLISFLF